MRIDSAAAPNLILIILDLHEAIVNVGMVTDWFSFFLFVARASSEFYFSAAKIFGDWEDKLVRMLIRSR